MKTIFKDVKGPEGSGSKAADEQTASVQAPQKNKLFDWVKVDFGFLHSKIIKKIFGFLGIITAGQVDAIIEHCPCTISKTIKFRPAC